MGNDVAAIQAPAYGDNTMFLAWPYYIAGSLILVAFLLRRNRDTDWPTRIFICVLALVGASVLCYILFEFVLGHFTIQ